MYIHPQTYIHHGPVHVLYPYLATSENLTILYTYIFLCCLPSPSWSEGHRLPGGRVLRQRDGDPQRQGIHGAPVGVHQAGQAFLRHLPRHAGDLTGWLPLLRCDRRFCCLLPLCCRFVERFSNSACFLVVVKRSCSYLSHIRCKCAVVFFLTSASAVMSLHSSFFFFFSHVKLALFVVHSKTSIGAPWSQKLS